jgi:heat shock protein HtpX
MTNHLKTLALLGGLTALLVGAGSLFAPGYMPIVLLVAVAMNAGAYLFSDRLVLRMNGARELAADEAPDLHRMVTELSARAEIPVPRLYLVAGAERLGRLFSTHPSMEERIARLEAMAGRSLAA